MNVRDAELALLIYWNSVDGWVRAQPWWKRWVYVMGWPIPEAEQNRLMDAAIDEANMSTRTVFQRSARDAQQRTGCKYQVALALANREDVRKEAEGAGSDVLFRKRLADAIVKRLGGTT